MSVNIKVTGGLNIEWGQIDPKVTGGLIEVGFLQAVSVRSKFIHRLFVKCRVSLILEVNECTSISCMKHAV